MTLCHRLSSAVGFLLLVVLVFALLVSVPVASQAQIEVGFCQGDPVLDTITICFLVCCPGDLKLTKVCATTAPVDCSSAAAVMAAINAAVAGMSYGGNPIFGVPVPVPSPIPGQARYAYPLGAAYAAAGCCVVGGTVSFNCGTVSLRINSPCAKPGGGPGGGGGPGPHKIGILGSPPGVPSTLVLIFPGCPTVTVPLAGTETPAMVASAVLAALTAAGFTAFINTDGEVEVTGDCNGLTPDGIDEFGLAGGAPMSFSLSKCPPGGPVFIEDGSWGMIKRVYH